jgi:hypothetical protein
MELLEGAENAAKKRQAGDTRRAVVGVGTASAFYHQRRDDRIQSIERAVECSRYGPRADHDEVLLMAVKQA